MPPSLRPIFIPYSFNVHVPSDTPENTSSSASTVLSSGSSPSVVLRVLVPVIAVQVIVFSSDFPHFEGFTDPIGHYTKALATLTPERRDRFYGGAIADVYVRMGDPLV